MTSHAAGDPHRAASQDARLEILFLMAHPGYARNFESTLRALLGRGHAVHMAYDRTRKSNLSGLWDPADALIEEYDSLTWGTTPSLDGNEWSSLSSRLRASLDYMRYLEPPFTDAPKLRARAERWAPGAVHRLATAPIMRSRCGRAAVRRSLRSAERAAPLSPEAEEYIRSQAPDVVLVTPLLEPGSQQLEFLRCARRAGIPTCLCVASWDNLTTKGLIHELPDRVAVWNEEQKQEAVELHDVPAERVVVTGAAAYDHWFEWKPSMTRQEFCTAVGLDPERPFLLYLGSSGFVAPDESAFVVEWMRGLHAHGLGEVQVLARPHPTNPLAGSRLSQRELARLGEVVLYPPGGANPTDTESKNDYFNSIHYSSAVIGVNTSGLVESALHGRPVHTILTPRYAETQEGSVHFRHLVRAGGGLLHVAETFEEHSSDLQRALAAPHPDGCTSERSLRFTRAFVRPHGVDQAATPKMVSMMESLVASPVRRPPGQMLAGGSLARLARRVRRQRARRAARVDGSAEGGRADTIAEYNAGQEGEMGVQAKEARTREKEARAREKAAREEKAARPKVRRGGQGRDPDRGADDPTARAKARTTEAARAKKARSREKELLGQDKQARAQLDTDAPLAVPRAWTKPPGHSADTAHFARTRRLEEQFVRNELEALARRDRPVIVGPFLGEVGFELLYWIPFIRWALEQYPELADRIVMASRGGTQHWYSGISDRYVDIFDLYSVEEFVARRSKLKQRGVTELEQEFSQRVSEQLELPAIDLLHPALMFGAYYRHVKADAWAYARSVEQDGPVARGLMSIFARLASPDAARVVEQLPNEFVAVRFYFRPSFPDTPENRRFALDVIGSLAEVQDVVLLNNELEIDDHIDLAPGPAQRVHRIHHLMQPADNLAVQTIVMSRARAFAGTYGGLGYLAPFMGLPSVCFESAVRPAYPWHLDLAQAVFAGPQWGSVSVLKTDDLAAVALTAGRDLSRRQSDQDSWVGADRESAPGVHSAARS